jgi:hypothetical protein
MAALAVSDMSGIRFPRAPIGVNLGTLFWCSLRTEVLKSFTGSASIRTQLIPQKKPLHTDHK